MRAWAPSALLICACAHVPIHAALPAPRVTASPPSPPLATSASAIPAPTPDSPEDALAREVAEIRGLPLKASLHVERLDLAAFTARTRGQPADDATTATYVAFGFMRHDLHAPAPMLGHASYLGIFDFATHELLLRDDQGPTAMRGVLVHEIGHALQDQSFGMPAMVEDDDAALAIKSLYEGDATLTRELYAAKQIDQPAADRVGDAIMIVRTHTRENVALGLGVPADAAREPRFGETISSYLDGMVFVASLWQKGGFALVDTAYKRLPASTEQILHPDKYLTDEGPIPVVPPSVPVGQKKLAEGTLGELRTRLLLARCSKTPAVGGWGWGGDRFVVGEGKDRELSVSWSTVWDTEGDAMRFESALRWVTARCWSSERRDGWWLGPRVSIVRSGSRVELVRGG